MAALPSMNSTRSRGSVGDRRATRITAGCDQSGRLPITATKWRTRLAPICRRPQAASTVLHAVFAAGSGQRGRLAANSTHGGRITLHITDYEMAIFAV